MSDDKTISNTGTVADHVAAGDPGIVDHSADARPDTDAAGVQGFPEDAPYVEHKAVIDPPAEQPNPMAHWLMIIENVAAGFRHMAAMSPMHAPLAGFAAKIEADLAKLRTFL